MDMRTPNISPIYQVQDGLMMWSCTTWQKGEIERDPERRGARALEAMEGWPKQVRNAHVCVCDTDCIETGTVRINDCVWAVDAPACAFRHVNITYPSLTRQRMSRTHVVNHGKRQLPSASPIAKQGSQTFPSL